jgi:geranylgeranyl reductase family protein
MEERPIVIVGAGPAGTATALYLHRLDPGLAARAVVLDKARHPRPKVCAGGLIPAAIQCLKDLDLELSVPHVAVQRARVATPSRTVSEDVDDMCFVVRRNEFDASLADACKERGIEVREDEPVLDLNREDGGVRVTTSRGEYRARMVVGADGSGSVVRRRLLGPDKTQIARAVMCDVPLDATSWEGFAARLYEFDFRPLRRGLRGYRWAFPCWIDGRPHVNVGAYTLTPEGKRTNDALTDYLAEMTSARPHRSAFPIRWYRSGTRIAAPHVLLAGDAAGVDPLMGEGISLAMEYGSFAAGAIRHAVQSGDFSGASYQRAVESSWLGRKLSRLHLATRLFYGPTWRFWFALAEHSSRLRGIGLRWYNGIDEWDRRSGWEAVRSVLGGGAVPKSPAARAAGAE